MAPSIRVLAVSFPTEVAARSAAAMLTRVFPLTREIRVAPLGEASYPVHARGVVVARFHEDVLAAVLEAVHEAGGTVEMSMPEDVVG